ncbi:hypothetical protein JOC48_000818 [Aquibacillus albus]|uniref:Uncharacterized protein n=1 Tax=Aquibacillus albus TaxID=1168171 RepID=A0ABS2MWV8_9BACI|nr:hypothetical protein [Aquibacillus albus]
MKTLYMCYILKTVTNHMVCVHILFLYIINMPIGYVRSTCAVFFKIDCPPIEHPETGAPFFIH